MGILSIVLARMLAAVVALSSACAWALPYAYVPFNSTLAVVDTATDTIVNTTGVTSQATGVAVSPDGTRVYVTQYQSLPSGFPGSVLRFNAAGAIIGGFTVGQLPWAAAYDPHANLVYVANGFGASVSIFDVLNPLTPIRTVALGASPNSVEVNPDAAAAGRAYVSGFDGTVSVLDASGAVATTIALGSSAFGMAFNRSGSRLYVATNAGVSIISTATNTVLTTVPVAGSPAAVVLNRAEDTWYVAANGSGRVEGFSVATNMPVMSVALGGAEGIDIARDDSRLYVVSQSDNRIRVVATAAPYTVTSIVGPAGTFGAPTAGRFIGPDVPRAPLSAAATPGNGQAGVSFAAPAYDGGMAITSYTATCGTQSATAASGPIVVTGLANGTPVTCTVVATNIVGNGPPSAPSNSVTPVGPPDPPTAVVLTAGDGQVSITLTAPLFDGGSAVLLYTATCGTHVVASPGFPFVVGGLTNGVPVACTVTASNASATSVPSAASNTVTPNRVPGAPTAVSAVAGNTQVTVSFTAPAPNGGPAITSYTATCGAQSTTGLATTLVVAGLANGTPVTCTVSATNAIGTGLDSAPSASVTPLGPPGAPTGVSAVAGNTQVRVSFTPPVSNGGSAITSYTASCGTQSMSGPGSPIVVAGLANGTPVTCTVTATNAVGTGPASAASNSVTPIAPANVPGAPQAVSALAGPGVVFVTFLPPASDGGSPITSYTVSCGSRVVSAGGSPVTVTGLPNGVPVSCSVTATSAIGTGPAASSNTVTPAPRSFTGPVATGLGNATVTITGGGLTCNFAPQGTGANQSAFFIPVSGSPKSPPAGTAPVTFPFGLLDFMLLDCDPGSTVGFTVVYPAAIPAGAQYWKYGPTASQASAHWYVLPATITGNTASFSITDGGLGDDDLTANGVIVDQGGPGGGSATVAPVPTLSEWAMILLTAMLGISGIAMRRREGAA